MRLPRMVGAGLLSVVLFRFALSFNAYCWALAPRLSHPSLISKVQREDGQIVTLDDYREGYWWLRDNTPRDARVMAWWDYGYQITGIANRTTLADGNTWNHEHIATIGRCLVGPVEESHDIIKHLADYVLIWVGRRGDLAKSPHMARIANSVYNDLCPGDPTCSDFGFHDQDWSQPTEMMEESLIFHMHQHGEADVQIDENLFELVFQSTNNML